MVEHEAEDRPVAALAAEAKRDDLRLYTPSGSRLSPNLNIHKSSRVLLLGLSGAAALLCGCSRAPRPAEAPRAALEASEDCHKAESERFALYSDPWINLHHFLFEWARNVPERQPEDRRRPVDVAERAQIADLDEGERQAWEHALTFYRERWVARDLVEDEDLIDLRDTLAAIACTAAGPDRIPADARGVLTDAMAVYRRHWWPGHHARNMKLIDEVLAGLSEHEPALAERMAEAYGGRWPAERIRVDMSAYANWSGAYTTNNPDHVTITSTTNPYITGLNAMEMLFHEVSHATFLEEPLLAELEAAFRAHGAEVPDGLAHVLQWVTPAELLRAQLHGEALRGFHTYAERTKLYERGRTTAERSLLEQHWVPFLDGKITRREALNRIAAALAPHRTAVRH
ncbi:MAG: hypothetical protein QOH06_4117 [Acidobacteriota bacterium]|jgi:hypothetical protein|nr:hypothetical protein [Acidobacteriota bacterium]